MDIEALEFADALSSTTLDQTATWWPATEKQGFAGANWGPHCQALLHGGKKTAQAPWRKKSREATGSRTEPSSASTTTKTRFGLPLSCARLSRRLSLA